MKIRNRLTYRFAIIVASIVLIFSTGVFYFAAQYRENEFYERLRDKALTTSRLLIEVDEVDSTLLKVIDRNKLTTLHDENVSIYNYLNQEIYSSDEDSLLADIELLNTIRLQREIKFREGSKEGIGVLYVDRYYRYVVIASAIDIDGKSTLRNLALVLFAGWILSTLIILAAGYVYSGQALAPISNVVKEVDNISASSLHLRLSEGESKDEISQLARTFNKMLSRIQTSFEVQKSFVANASHELRTPLTALLGQIEVTRIKKRSADEYNELLLSLQEDMEKMKSLINNLLELAQTDMQVDFANSEILRMDEILLSAIADLMKRKPSFRIHIDIDQSVDLDDFQIRGNEPLLRTAILNLIDNACKFSDDDSADVYLSRENNLIKVKVSDKGRGISKEDLEKIKIPFYRTDEVRNTPGHGIGLSLADRIIALHNGILTIESELNKGTSVEIKLHSI